MLRSPALEIPFADGDAHEWVNLTLKSSPVANLPLTLDAQWITSRPAATSALIRERRARRGEVLVPLTARAPANHRERWPWHVERETAPGLNGLMPRGRVFEHFIADPTEPRRSGLYEFCIVGVDLDAAARGDLRYHAWEPTGHQDRTFCSDEVDRRFALEHFGRSVALMPRPRRGLEDAHCKRSVQAGLAAVVRWPDGSSAEGLVHAGMLPDVDERGRPVITFACRFAPRNSADLVAPLMYRWWREFAASEPGPVAPSQPGSASVGPAARRTSLAPLSAESPPPPLPQRILVLDGTGRLAARIASEAFRPAEVLAVDDPQRPTRTVLKAFRDRSHFPVHEGKFDRARPALLFPDSDFDITLLPFTLHRLCQGDEGHFLALVREALRVSRQYVLIAEDIVGPGTDEAAIRRWKARFRATFAALVLLDGDLRGGRVADHFLSASGLTDCPRRFLILQASAERLASGFGSVGGGVEAPQATAKRHESASVAVLMMASAAERAPLVGR